ncbi:cyclic AMP-responsive element-binding protein 1-like [Tachysurus vachellii]|uniref:cyclic AMP-responsive element-binding protein 1-like n=1 Tax=Tachysurus vachellii TaxID=175792 RepID=UPI00296B45A9|nr:cyclic AMP-responsive element-binding protein 1-like [Tachysurus vachellii]
MSLADAEMSTEEAAPPSVQAPNRSQTSATGDVSAEEASHRRELRLMKSREASREYRRKQKEYIQSLENRIADVEKENKTLIQQRHFTYLELKVTKLKRKMRS